MRNPARAILLVSFLACASDSLTGISLLVVPGLTLRMMGVQVDPVAMVFIRYIGVFVLAVGTSYLAGIWPAVRTSRWEALRTVWIVTAWIRLLVCFFTTGSIIQGALGLAWISVPLTDGFLALLQGGWVYLGPWPGGKDKCVS